MLIQGGARRHEIEEFTTKAFKGDYEHLILEVGRWVTLEVTE